MIINEIAEQTLENVVRDLEEQVRHLLQSGPACHDWEHTSRVRQLAKILAPRENADPFIVDVAALLHDIGRPQELQDQGRSCHAQSGAQMVPQLLKKAGVVNREFINIVATCVRTHRFRSRLNEKPESPEAKVVFDADKLDSLGAIGLARAFHFAGRIGAQVHNRREEALAGKSYSQQDSAYREFLVKLRQLPDCMLTKSGRQIARERRRFMENFFAVLDQEYWPAKPKKVCLDK